MKKFFYKYHLQFGLLLAVVLPGLFIFKEPVPHIMFLRFISAFTYIITLWIVNFFLVDFRQKGSLAKSYRWYLRIILAFVTSASVYIVVGLLIDNTGVLMAQVRGDNFYTFKAWFFLILRLLLLNTLILIIKYLFDIYEEKRKIEIENQILKNENLQALHEVLKNQLQPHFLFNSLNTLKALIKRDPLIAENFVSELASVYRYMLLHQNKNVVTLEEEVQFLKSYLYLLNLRFGDAIQAEFTIPSAILNVSIPPNTLQLLIENAVKHNLFSLKRQLTISLFQWNDFLVIQNNLQLKEVTSESSAIGLKNINTRYQLLFNKDIIIKTHENYFQVLLPIN